MSDQTDWKMHFKIAAFDVIGRLRLWQWPSQETNFTSPNPINMVRATSIQQVLCIMPKTCMNGEIKFELVWPDLSIIC